MFYIITYATHSERYFETLIQNTPEIIVLGMGMPWNGFYDKIKGVIDFCRTKNPEDIVLYIDAFDSVILSSREEILEKYYSLESPLVFSKGANSSSILVKYSQDKLFGKCKNQRLNAGLFMGTSASMLDF